MNRDNSEAAHGTLQRSNSMNSVMSVQPTSDGIIRSKANGPISQIILRISVPSQNIQKSVRVASEEPFGVIKLTIIEKMAKNIVDALNYGFFIPGTDGKEGKFLDEQRTPAEYRLADNIALEFRLKHRQGTNPESKGYEKENNKKNFKKLLDLIKDGKVDEVKSKLSKGMDPNFVFDDGITPLILAVLINDRDMICALLENGAHIDFRAKPGAFTNSGVSPTPNQFGSTFFTPMHVAATENRLIALQTLMNFGGSPNVRDSAGLTPLYHASAAGHHEIVKWILVWSAVHYKESRLNIELEIADSQGRTALHHACLNGFPHVVHLLIEYGLDIKAQNSAGNTPLHASCTKPMSGPMFKECAKHLLNYGAEKEKRNKAGQTPAQIALLSGNIELSDFIKKFTIENVMNPPPLDVLVETSRVQWQNVKKMMQIGKTNLSTMQEMHSNHSLAESFGGSVRVPKQISRQNIHQVFSQADSTTSFKNMPESQVSRSASHHEMDNHSQSSQSGLHRESSSESLPQQQLAQQFTRKRADSNASQLQPTKTAPIPQSQPQANYAATPVATALPGQPTTMGRTPRLPPPPPPGVPPTALPNLAHLPPPPAIPMNLPPPPALAGAPMSNLDILTQLQRIEDEKKKLEAEVERLRQHMLAQLQQSPPQ